MSLAITHFAVGATGMILILELTQTDTDYRASLVLLSGLWGLIPDLHYVAPIFADKLKYIKQSIWGNVFWFHGYLDGLQQGRGSRRVAVIVVFIFLTVTVLSEVLPKTGSLLNEGPSSNDEKHP